MTDQNIEQQIDRIIKKLFGPKGNYYTDDQAKAAILALISKQVSEARKEQVMQDFNTFLVNVDQDEKEIIDWRNNMLEEIDRQTPPTPNAEDNGASEKPQPEEEAGGKQVDNLTEAIKKGILLAPEIEEAWSKYRGVLSYNGFINDQIQVKCTGLVPTPPLATTDVADKPISKTFELKKGGRSEPVINHEHFKKPTSHEHIVDGPPCPLCGKKTPAATSVNKDEDDE